MDPRRAGAPVRRHSSGRSPRTRVDVFVCPSIVEGFGFPVGRGHGERMRPGDDPKTEGPRTLRSTARRRCSHRRGCRSDGRQPRHPADRRRTAGSPGSAWTANQPGIRLATQLRQARVVPRHVRLRRSALHHRARRKLNMVKTRPTATPADRRFDARDGSEPK